MPRFARVAVLALAVALCAPVSAGADTSTDSYAAFSFYSSAAEKCNLTEPLYIAEPAADGRYPVLVYIHGTNSEKGDLATSHAVIEDAAAAGWVGVAPVYVGGNTLSAQGIENQTRCMFNPAATTRTVLSAVCSRPKADCSRLAVAGHSQGGSIAMRADNWTSVAAVWALGVFSTDWEPGRVTSVENGGNRALPNDRLRIVTGQSDIVPFGTNPLNRMTGSSCAWGVRNCLRPDGSGFFIVPNATPPDGPTDGYADHCYMELDGNRCYLNKPVDPAWRTGTSPWTLPAALAWLRSKVG